MGNVYSVYEHVKCEDDEGYRWQVIWEGDDTATALLTFLNAMDQKKIVQLVGRGLD